MTKERIEFIVEEICRIEPSLAGRRAELIPLVARLVEARPEAEINPAFVAELRRRLLSRAPARNLPKFRQPFFFAHPSFALAGGLAALALIVGAPFLLERRGGEPSGPIAMIDPVGREAFGPLAGLGGPGESAGLPAGQAGASLRSQSGGGGDMAAPFGAGVPAFGGGGVGVDGVAKGGMTMPMIAPQEMVRIEYVYSGSLPELAESGLVYKRVNASHTRALSSLIDLDLDLADLASFANPTVTQFTMEDGGNPGYLIFVDLVRGSVSINTDWRDIAPMGMEKMMAPSAGARNISDASAIAIADAFLADHGINRSGFGEPFVVRAPEYRIMAEGAAAPTDLAMPISQYLTVRYPLLVGGLAVFEQHGEAAGLSVNIDTSRARVQDVYGLELQSYQSSAYPLLTDAAKILDLAKRGGGMYGPYPMPAMPVKEGEPYPAERVVTATLGEPQRALVRYWRARPDMKEADELLVPSLVFPVVEGSDPAGWWYVQQNVIVPLIPELVEQSIGEVRQ